MKVPAQLLKVPSRVYVILSALLLSFTFFTPLWLIEIWAPQYPEGLYMQIWSSKITGDLQTINILNHYIGMKAIHPEGFAELQWFPKAFGTLIGLGLILGAIGKKWSSHLWTLVLLSFALWAFYDFWKWEYDFGNNLSEDAAIKMDGMTYAPPLIGHKEILNISAWSLPGLAGYAMTLSVGLAVLNSLILFLGTAGAKTQKVIASLALVAFVAPNAACFSPKAEPILFGKDSCHSCKMTLTDKRFGAEAVNDKGKAFKFDSVECLDGYLNEHKDEKLHLFVVDSTRDGSLIPMERAWFYHKEDLRSPMGKGLVASDETSRLKDFISSQDPKYLKWDEVKQVIKE